MTQGLALYEPQTFHLEPMAPSQRYPKHSRLHKHRPRMIRDFMGPLEQAIVARAQQVYLERINDK